MKATIKKGLNENKSFSELRDEIVKFKNNGGSQDEAQRILEELRNDFEEEEEKEDTILDLLDHVTGWCSLDKRIWEEERLFFSDEDDVTKRNVIIEEDGNSIWAYLTVPEKIEIDKDCYLCTRYDITIEELDLESFKQTKTPPPMIKKYSTEWSQIEEIKEEDLLVEWYQNGNVLLKIKGDPFLFFHKDESRGFSKSIKEDCQYGNAWNEDKLREIFK